MKKIMSILLTAGFLAAAVSASEYMAPSSAIKEMFDAYPVEYMRFDINARAALRLEFAPYPPIAKVAEKTIPLAGERISPLLGAEREMHPVTAMKISDLQGNIFEMGLPGGIEIRDMLFSYSGRWLAFTVQERDSVRLWIGDLEKRRAWQVKKLACNDLFRGESFEWTGDDRLIVLAVPRKGRPAPAEAGTVIRPVTDETSGTGGKARTYQNLLSGEDDILLFDSYALSELAVVYPENGKVYYTGLKGIFESFDVSPSSEKLLVTEIAKPYSYSLPYYYFPKRFFVYNIEKRKKKVLYQRPLQDSVPIGGVFTGPRNMQWVPLSEDDIIWVEALDGGDPRKEVPYRDRIMRLSGAADADAKELAKTEFRYSGIDWGEDSFIVYDFDRDSYRVRGTLRAADGTLKNVLIDMSYHDIYNAPGDSLKRKVPGGEVMVARGGSFFFINSKGATPGGNRPFLMAMDSETGKRDIIFRSSATAHELPITFAGGNTDKLIISAEDTEHPRNYSILELDTGRRLKLTDYKNPYAGMTGLRKELVKYTREDGIELSGTLFLPPDYDGSVRLPLFIWAYPEEYRDPDKAGQIDISPNRFTRLWGDHPALLALAGYAVLYNATIPIVGEAQTVNDSFIRQTVSSIEAAVDYLDSRGITDPARTAVGGHSYGAFMTANVLANSDVCVAGIARSGAYNRSLTPFGFQSERRTFWEAPDFYCSVSPFMHADNLKEPLLMIHGELDPNPGTFPVQSQRMFDAVKGNGGTARLVLLPFEGHGYSARESLLHVLYEMERWLDRYLK